MTPLLRVRDLRIEFPTGSAVWARLRRRPRRAVVAVDGISFEVARGASVGVVGESGCGKSTLARALTGLVPVAAGSIGFEGAELGARRERSTMRRIQMVFQDPGSSLNPSRTVGQTLTELLRVHRMVPTDRVRERAGELLELVELPSSLLAAYPRRLSGGQRQRVGIARALALEPDVLIADEAVAALDVSVQASVLNLLSRLRRELGLTLLFISHDLAVVRHVSERVLVMYLGRIVEDRPTADLFADPRHPYTIALMGAAPKMGMRKRSGQAALQGEPPGLFEIPPGCRFHPRCPIAQPICSEVDPQLIGPAEDEKAACHFAWTARPSGPVPGAPDPTRRTSDGSEPTSTRDGNAKHGTIGR
jgi:oligopeptide/dipeptide ABC transporter ATP-binding protein